MIHGYVRVSTAEQAVGTSPEEQERRIRLSCELSRELSDRGPQMMYADLGVSGGTPLGERPAGASLIAAARPGDAIIAAKLDRLFRNAQDALTRSRAWREQGIDLVLLDMGTDPVTTSAAGRLYFGMLAQFAEFERERINERTRDGKASKRARGGFAGGHAPIGYSIVGRGKEATLKVNPAEVDMIAFVKRQPPDSSPTLIAQEMNLLGYRSRKGTLIRPAQVWRWRRTKEVG